MQKEIGSNFELNPEMLLAEKYEFKFKEYGISGNDELLLSTGRGAERLVLDTILLNKPDLKRIALIPPFTCETVVEPFLERDFTVYTYPIKENLNIDVEDFVSVLERSGAQVILVHRYFGFDTLKNFEKIIEKYRKNGIIFIEDKTQCLYSKFHNLSTDYIVGSLRKWAALPDGGYAVCKTGVFKDKPLGYDKKLEEKKVEASLLKYKFLHEGSGVKKQFLDIYREAEDILDSEQGYFKISPVSEKIQCNLNIEELKRKRRKNYERLYNGLKEISSIRCLTPQLGVNDIPLYFALLTDKRHDLQIALRDKCVYAPIVWPKYEFMPEICKEAQMIYDLALCIPIDQRYDTDDMERIISCIREFYNKCQ